MTGESEHSHGRRFDGPEASFEINPVLNLDALQREVEVRRRLHIKELLDRTAAESLYHALAGDFAWSTFLTSEGRRYEAPYDVQQEYTEDQAREMIDRAHRSARERGFGYVFEARALGATAPEVATSPLERLVALVNSKEFAAIIGCVCGAEEISRIEIQAVRLRPGHFMSFHETLIDGDKEEKCRASFAYNLTPEWKPEWGGLLAFRSAEGHLVEAYAPCFNCLDIFALPQGRLLTVVSPFAVAPAYSVSGCVYVR